MPLQLPNLDDRSYNDLVEEGRSLIPTYAPEWTNHNPSDPGIMLLELFAYLAEMLLYRLNRVTDDNLRQFLKLLNGPDWQQTQDLPEEVRLAVLGVRERHRAVTCTDFELLTTENFNRWLAQMQQKEQNSEPPDEWWRVTGLDSAQEGNRPSKVEPVRRAYCVPRKNLDAGSEVARRQTTPAHISLIVVPSEDNPSITELGPQPTSAQRQAVWGYLDERRLLTTRHHVVGPFYTPVSPEILVARHTDVPPENLRNRMTDKIKEFLHPLRGGPEGEGWPFGRDVYVSELYELLEKVEGVDYLPDIMLISECQPEEKRCIAAEPIWHDDGDIIGLRLFDHHLPAVRLDPNRIVIAPNMNFLAVQLAITVTPAAIPATDPKILKRLIKTKTREIFHPLYDGPKPNASADTTITLEKLTQEVKKVVGVQQVEVIDLQSDLAHLLRDDDQKISGVLVKAGEVVDLRWRVEVKSP